jgi:hypothetical protein
MSFNISNLISVFLFKFLKQVHWLGSSALISSKWRLSWWTSRSFFGVLPSSADLQEHTV